MLSNSASTVLGALAHAAEHSTKGIRFVAGGAEVRYLSYAELYREATKLAAGMLERGLVRKTERVGLVTSNSPEAIIGFFGLMAAGAVPVPLPAPHRFSKVRRYEERIRGSLAGSAIDLVVTPKALSEFVRSAALSLGVQEVGVVEELASSAPGRIADLGGEDVAFIQYTSGSTTKPKGVVLRHRQVMANVEAIARATHATKDEVGCVWLPLFHDMGLVGCLFAGVWSGCEVVMMSPEEFIVSPLSWLRLFGKYGGTMAPAPNAAYAHCIRQIGPELVKSLDLSTWRCALNGAEPVDAELGRRFSEHFRPAGFRAEAYTAVYGMAEATLAVTMSPIDRPQTSMCVTREGLGRYEVVPADAADAGAREIVSAGPPVFGMEVRIRDVVSGEYIEEGGVGEVCIRGSSVTTGYEGDAQTTRAAFHAGFLLTGDLGFMRGGELYVVGRSKEVIIMRGVNYYPNDIEKVALEASAPAIETVMALGVGDDGTEALVILAEHQRGRKIDQEALSRAIREAVSGTFGVSPRDVCFFVGGTLPRTTSGKLQRFRGAELYQEQRDKAAAIRPRAGAPAALGAE
jgi:fatty-acyl-CoA synthase